ncbi:MAG TPA: hypothetical protein VFI73_09925 [Candidatus Nitrosopolaris sp.]|nr:hypothetical protein [Candidatus Nitrosopolaris sp.]
MMVASVIGLSILTTNWFIPVLAVGIGNGGGASVIQEQVNSGNPNLDKEINKFYSCISKTNQDPPSKQIVDNCYSQNAIAGITGPGNHNHNNVNNINNNNKDIIKTPSIKIARPPPGILVEVP